WSRRCHWRTRCWCSPRRCSRCRCWQVCTCSSSTRSSPYSSPGSWSGRPSRA
ncbi:MAG: hypothetical protein AVDCRST_MAG72-2196, partial [uncultured Nocardioidaceae bacterium]